MAMESIDLKKRPDAKQFEELLSSLDPDKDGKIKVAELGPETSLRLSLAPVPDPPPTPSPRQVAELHQIIKSLEMRDDDEEENPHGHDKGKKEKEAAS